MTDTPQEDDVADGGLILCDDHWADSGGRTVRSLKEFLSQEHLDAILVDSVEEMRQLVFGDLALHL